MAGGGEVDGGGVVGDEEDIKNSKKHLFGSLKNCRAPELHSFGSFEG